MLDYLMLVNKDNKLNKDYVPDNLVEVKTIIPGSVDVNRKIYLEKNTAQMWLKLKGYMNYLGFDIDISSGYRSYEYQEKLFNKKVSENGLEQARKIVALPGTSEHQTGLCFDYEKYCIEDGVVKSGLTQDDIEYKIIKEIAHEYGFIVRYPKGKENITKYSFEPWHLRYVGDASRYIYEHNLTLEEYHEKKLVKSNN